MHAREERVRPGWRSRAVFVQGAHRSVEGDDNKINSIDSTKHYSSVDWPDSSDPGFFSPASSLSTSTALPLGSSFVSLPPLAAAPLADAEAAGDCLCHAGMPGARPPKGRAGKGEAIALDWAVESGAGEVDVGVVDAAGVEGEPVGRRATMSDLSDLSSVCSSVREVVCADAWRSIICARRAIVSCRSSHDYQQSATRARGSPTCGSVRTISSTCPATFSICVILCLSPCLTSSSAALTSASSSSTSAFWSSSESASASVDVWSERSSSAASSYLAVRAA